MFITRTRVTVASCIVALLPAIAQTQDRSGAPLAFGIVSTALDGTGYEVMRLNVTNVSPYPVKAYVLRMELLNGAGKLIGVTEKSEVGPVGGPIEKRSWSPGEGWEVEWRIP
jgi:hypothetical protein